MVNETAAPGSGQQATLSRAECEDFLYHEAALLDEWRLDEWFDLFAEGATYEVPTAGSADDVDSATSLFYIADDYSRLRYRVDRLNSPAGHSERPRSDSARAIHNVRVLGKVDNGVAVGCTFTTYRSKNNRTDMFVGHMRYVLRRDGEALKIVSKRVLLDINSLRPQGRVSIIL